MKLIELAEATSSTISQGQPNIEVTSAAGMDIAGANDVTFLANPRYTPQIKTTKAAAIFLSENAEIDRKDIAVLRAKDPYVAYTLALREFFPFEAVTPGIHPTAVIDKTATVPASCEIGPNVVIGANAILGENVRIIANATVYHDAKVGEGSVVHSGVAIREYCEVGDNCIIHNNSTIGSDGFGYAKNEDKSWLKIPQAGRVVLEDDVEIGANSAIDCASVGETRIKRGAKIDNLVQIGHSCTVDEDTLICAQTGLAGTSVIGKRVILTGQVGIAGHIRIGNDVIITAQSAAAHDVPDGSMIGGPNLDNRTWIKVVRIFERLPELVKTVRGLDKRVSEIESRDKNG